MKNTGILYATNKDYLTITLASMLSLIENVNGKKLDIYFMTENLNVQDYALIEKIVKEYPNVHLSIYPIESFHLEKYGIPGWQNTQAANARLFFQKVLGDQIDEIEELLYLDSDTIVVDNLAELNRYNGKIHAVLDNAAPSYLDQLGVARYFNSGVLKINTNWWKKENCEEKIIKFVRDNPMKKLTYPDQDILNYVLGKEIEEMPMSYNLPPSVSMMNGVILDLYCKKIKRDTAEIIAAKKTPKILHSYGLLGIKPWTDNEVNPYNDIFRRYLYKVNPEFELQELDSMKKLLSTNPRLFNSLFLLKSYTPECLQGIVKKTALTFYKQKKTNRNKK